MLEDLNVANDFNDEMINILFSVIDDDDSETITLEELKNKLLSIKILTDVKNGDVQLSNKSQLKSAKIVSAKKL